MIAEDLAITSYICTTPYAPITDLEEDLLANKGIVVIENENYYGILETSDVILSQHSLAIDCIHNRPRVQKQDNFDRIQNSFNTTLFNLLPVFDDNHFYGLIDRTKICLFQHISAKDILLLLKDIYSQELSPTIIYNNENGDILFMNNACKGSNLDVRTSKVTELFPEIDPLFFMKTDSALQIVNESPFMMYTNEYGQVPSMLRQKTLSIVNTEFGLLAIDKINTQKYNTIEKNYQNFDRKKSFFLQCVSHELRTPLNGILGMANLLKDENLSTDGRNHLSMLIDSSSNLLELVNDILDFEQMENGIFKLQNIEFNFEKFFKDTISVIKVLSKHKGIVFKYSHTINKKIQLIGDSKRLRQVLTNLLVNAIKFTNLGEISISASSQLIDQNKILLTFIISDTGTGIDSLSLKRIFEPYYQVNDESKYKKTGFGLGLTIVKQLVKQMNGSIEVKSEPGLGTEFEVSLPFVLSGYLVEKTNENLQADSVFEKYTILVVEDELINNVYITAFIKKIKAKIFSVNNGKEAIDIVSKEKIDLILMDVSMPVMDGIEATRYLRKKLHFSNPIIALTAHAYDENRNECIKAGMDGYLSKPINEKQLLNTLSEQLMKL
jgi:signal transduction histidine kinase